MVGGRKPPSRLTPVYKNLQVHEQPSRAPAGVSTALFMKPRQHPGPRGRGSSSSCPPPPPTGSQEAENRQPLDQDRPQKPTRCSPVG
ncbi:hypothetical protein PBY51_011178 [Eleginops maclovinus]|uniref:Uncharacterized protein n=1 Tax=Eleginops maclovinus TaxID=56733 RepID=A0AAN7XAR6_ELEMC|nr:hypothetical protein PBY51_011178 [Eleginops maclovinus]